MNPNVNRFQIPRLERASDLVESVNAQRLDLASKPCGERHLLCEFWVYRARELLQGELGQDDRQSCLWVLHVARGITGTFGFYVNGLSEKHTGNWASLRRAAGERLRARRLRESSEVVHVLAPRPVVIEVRHLAAKEECRFPNMVGWTILVVGGVEDRALVDRYRDAGFALDWVPGGSDVFNRS
jgi:hypothetical protein